MCDKTLKESHEHLDIYPKCERSSTEFQMVQQLQRLQT